MGEEEETGVRGMWRWEGDSVGLGGGGRGGLLRGIGVRKGDRGSGTKCWNWDSVDDSDGF